MAEYIEREAALRSVCYDCTEQGIVEKFCGIPCADYDRINSIPAADVRENVIRTQADKLRAMSDDELAKWLYNVCCIEEPFECPALSHPQRNVDCRKIWLDWLKQEVEE